MATQLVEFNSGIVDFFCPACGGRICGEDGLQKSCDHLLFIWLSELGEWEHARVDLTFIERDEEGEIIPTDNECLDCLPKNSIVFHFYSGAPAGDSLAIGVQIPD